MIKISPRKLNYIYQSLPNFCWPLKWYIKKKSLNKCGKKFRFGINSQFNDHRLITIGDNVYFGQDTIINTHSSVDIGNNVMFGPRVTIIGGDHNYSDVGIIMKEVKSGGSNQPVVIEDDVWIGAGVIILKGVTIHEGSIVGAASVVTKSIPPYSVCLGNPCIPISFRFKEKYLAEHLIKVNSKYTSDEVTNLFNE